MAEKETAAREKPTAEESAHEDSIDADTMKLIQTNPSVGLTDAEVTERLNRFGPNGIFIPLIIRIAWS